MLAASAAFLYLTCAGATFASGQTPGQGVPPSPTQYTVKPTMSPIRVDGVLDEPAWREVAEIPLRYEYFPGDNTPARAETICMVTFDHERLYLAFRAKDADPGAIRANLADRDAPFLDDTVGFMLDTFNDGRRAFQFRVNARGVQMDAFNSDVDGSEDWSWDAIWDAKARIMSDGYTVEVAVPFTSLRFPRSSTVQTWGFMAMRDMPRSTRYRIRSGYFDRNRQCLICQFDKLTGFEQITPGRNVELDPTATLARTDERNDIPSGSLAAGRAKGQAGISARWSVTPNIVLSGTANPDFYQVEADAAQLDVNTRFQLFFPEKRPFFLEAADIFSTPIDSVFTRTVADPDWGLKVTGKQGANAFGVFAARDSVTGIVVPGYEGSTFRSLDRRYTSNVVRYRRDIGRSGSTIGVIYAGREGDAYSNHVGGLDGLIRLSKADSVRVAWQWSRTDYPDEMAAETGQPDRPFTGQAYALRYAHGTRNWNWGTRLEGFSPAFRADSGFVPQVEYRAYQAYAGRTVWGGPARWFNRLDFSASFDLTEDWKGRRSSWGCDFPIEYEGRWQMSASYNPACNREYYQGRTYDNFRHNIYWSVRPSGAFSLEVSATVGGNIDFANAQKGDMARLNIGGTFNLFRRFEGEVSQQRQTLDVAGGRLFTADLSQARLLYHINLRTFVRAILQYTDIDRNPALYRSPTSPSTRRLFSQYLFSFKVNPQTVLLIGYSDNASGSRGIDLTRSDRTFFCKIGYAVVY